MVLVQIADAIDELLRHSGETNVHKSLNVLENSATAVGNAWSKSWFGYQASVYYRYFATPENRAYFNKTQGLSHEGFYEYPTTGDWVEYDADQVTREIHDRAGNPDLSAALALRQKALQMFLWGKRSLLSIIDIELTQSYSEFLVVMREELNNLTAPKERELTESWRPEPPFETNDRRAVQQGMRMPPHLSVLSRIKSIRYTLDSAKSLAEIARHVESHLSRRRTVSAITPMATTVFIGHGHSLLWRELKDFLVDRLGLTVDEFNRLPTAGIPVTGRLSAMLDTAGMAFLVMTGEDEQRDGKFRARENVVHEVGLLQGRLGFERAIILLEDGCEEFSNVAGLGQIRFPKGNIGAIFEEVRRVLQREKLLGG